MQSLRYHDILGIDHKLASIAQKVLLKTRLRSPWNVTSSSADLAHPSLRSAAHHTVSDMTQLF